MNPKTMTHLSRILVAIYVLLSPLGIYGQQPNERSFKEHFLSLTVEKMECEKNVAKQQESNPKVIDDDPLLGPYKDVIIAGPTDDLVVYFTLRNLGDTSVYFLAEKSNGVPPRLGKEREKGSVEWKSTSINYDRPDAFSGGGYEWRKLPPASEIKFHYTESSSQIMERKIVVFVNDVPKSAMQHEVSSDVFIPLLRNGCKCKTDTVAGDQ